MMAGTRNTKTLVKIKSVRDWIGKYWNVHEYSPSRRELAEHFQTSTSVIGYYLARMVELGMIKPLPFNTPRAIVLIKDKKTT